MTRTITIVMILSFGAALAACTTSAQRKHGDVVVGGRAIFKHRECKMENFDCTECHDRLYTNVMQHKSCKMDQIFFKGESCGSCHNGTRAFSTQGNCPKCHRKS
jgi:c(7)-type cytochrome triheme protein